MFGKNQMTYYLSIHKEEYLEKKRGGVREGKNDKGERKDGMPFPSLQWNDAVFFIVQVRCC
jgi:hypothetical protein